MVRCTVPLVCALVAGSCGSGDGGPRVLAAASIADGVAAVAAQAGIECRVSAAASSVLAQQVLRGGGADLFVSAHREWMDRLAAAGALADGTRAVVAENVLVWVAPSPTAALGPPAPAAWQRLAVGDPAHVPVGRYAKKALEALGTWSRWAPRLVPCADARAALALVERGEVDGGIVYRSDAAGSAHVRILGPLLQGGTVTYEVARLAGGEHPSAESLRRALLDATGQQVFEHLGFGGDATAAPAPSRPRAVATGRPWDALRLSLIVGTAATLLALPPAILLALWLARTRSRWGALVDGIVVLPMVLPPVVVGYGLLVLFGRQGLLPTDLPFTLAAAGCAALVMGFPLLARALRQGFEAVDPGLEEAAATLGAGRLRVLFTVTLPLAWPALLAGAGLCFARSLGEFGATITFAGNVVGETRTLPLAIWTALQEPGGEGRAWRMTLVCVAVSLAAAGASEWLLRRRRAR